MFFLFLSSVCTVINLRFVNDYSNVSNSDMSCSETVKVEWLSDMKGITIKAVCVNVASTCFINLFSSSNTNSDGSFDHCGEGA